MKLYSGMQFHTPSYPYAFMVFYNNISSSREALDFLRPDD